MASWDEIITKYGKYYFFDIYIKVNKEIQVYSHASENGLRNIKWEGWKVPKDSVAGELSSIRFGYTPLNSDNRGKWFFMHGTPYTQGKDYYLFLKISDIDWDFFGEQVRIIKGADMNFIEKFIFDMKNAANDEIDNVVDYVTSAIYVGGAVCLVMLYWNFIGRYQVQAKILKSGAKELIQEFKK